MNKKENQFWTRSRQVRTSLIALLAAIFMGGSLSELTAQRSGVLAANSSYQQTLYCASDDERRNYCAVDTRGGVRLVRQRSGSACTQGRTWGYDRNTIWVDRGCRADFEIGNGDSSGNRGRGRGRGGDNGNYGRDGNGETQTFYCESGDGKRHWCKEGIGGEVRLVNQRSGSSCVQGRTWGQDRAGVWVDRGCRADFEVTQRYRR